MFFLHQLRGNLEESISQLQTQRLSRTNGLHSASASTLHTSDLEPSGSGMENTRCNKQDFSVLLLSAVFVWFDVKKLAVFSENHSFGISEGQRFYPTSPLKDYSGSPRRRRRSQSANVHFKDRSGTGEDVRNIITNHTSFCLFFYRVATRGHTESVTWIKFMLDKHLFF